MTFYRRSKSFYAFWKKCIKSAISLLGSVLKVFGWAGTFFVNYWKVTGFKADFS